MDQDQTHWTPDIVSKFWDHESKYPEHYFCYQYGAEIAKVIKRFVSPGSTILDYAAGPGFLIPHLLDRFKVCAKDLSGSSMSQLSRFSAHDNFIGPQKKYDAILLIEVVEHLYDKDLNCVMREVKEKLNPGGGVFITTPNDEDLKQSIVFCPHCDNSFHRWQHVRSWDAYGLKNYLTSCGFTNITAKTFDFSSTGFTRVHRKLRGISPHLFAFAKN